MTALKNPGQEVAKVLDFETYPDPREFLRYGGYPGVSYLYVLSENCASAAKKNWDPINQMPHFNVKGHSMTIMAKGRPSLTASPGSSKPIFFIDPKAVEKLAMELSLEGETRQPEPKKPTPPTPLKVVRPQLGAFTPAEP